MRSEEQREAGKSALQKDMYAALWQDEGDSGLGVPEQGPCELLGTFLCFRHEELDHLARERDAVLMAAKSAHMEQLQAADARALELQARCENLEVQLSRSEWKQVDATKEKDATIDK